MSGSNSGLTDTMALRDRERQSYLPAAAWNTPDWQLALNGVNMPNYEALLRHTMPSVYVSEKPNYELGLKEFENTPRSAMPPSNVYPAEQNPIGYEGRVTGPEFRAASGPMPSGADEPIKYYDQSGRGDIRMQNALLGDPSKPVTPRYIGNTHADLVKRTNYADELAQWIAAIPGMRGSFVNPPTGNAAMQRALAAETGVPHYMQHGAIESGYAMPFEPPGLPGVPKQSYVVPARATGAAVNTPTAPVEPFAPKSDFVNKMLEAIGERAHRAADWQDVEDKLAPKHFAIKSPIHAVLEWLHASSHGSDKGKH